MICCEIKVVSLLSWIFSQFGGMNDIEKYGKIKYQFDIVQISLVDGDMINSRIIYLN